MWVLGDEIVEPIEPVTSNPSLLWPILGIVAGVVAVTAIITVMLVKKKKRGR